MAFSLELTRRLHDVEEPPAKRLRLAHAAFESSELPVQRKEEVILNWICTEEDLDKKSFDLWNTLLSCIQSDRLKYINVNDVRPSVKSSLIKMFCETLENEQVSSTTHSVISDCAFSVLDSPHFEHALKKSPEEYFGLVSAILKHVTDEKRFTNIIDNIILSYEKSFQKQHFSRVFIRQALSPLVGTYERVKSTTVLEDTSPRGLHVKILKSFQVIVFSKQYLNERLKFLNALFLTSQQLTVESSLNELTNLLLQLSYGLIKLPDNVIIRIYSLIFEAFHATHKKQNVALFQFSVLCAYLVGFSPKVKHPNGDVSLFGMTNFSRLYEGYSQPICLNQMSFRVMNVIVTGLKKLEISLEGTVRNVSFTQWLHALFHSVFVKKRKWKASPECLELLCIVSDLCPFAAESQIYNVLWCIMLASKDTPELVESYSKFMVGLCNLFTKVSSLPKFLDKMLNMLQEKIETNIIQISVEDIFPDAWCRDLHIKMCELPSSQCLVVFHNFVNQLLENCVRLLEDKAADTKLELFTHILSKLLCLFLDGVKLATYTVPLGIVNKFKDIMEELKHVLGRMGIALLNHEHNVPVLESFLDICYYWGEVNVILIHYVNHDVLDVVKDDTSACSIAGIHSYITNDQWNLISERIINFGDTSCHSKMKALIIQKLQVLKLFNENGYSHLRIDTCSAAAKYLLKSYTPSEIFHCLTRKKTELLLTCLDSSQLLFVAKQCLLEILSDSESFEDKMSLLLKNQVFEVKDFSAVFIGLIISEIAKIVTDKHSKTSVNYCLLNPLVEKNILTLLKSNELKTICVAMGKNVHSVLSREEKREKVNDMDLELLRCHLRLLMSLPVPYMHEDIQRVAVLSILTVGWFINGSDSHHHSDAINRLYCELLLDIMEKSSDFNLTGYVHLGYLYEALVKHASCLDDKKKRALFKHMFLRHLKDDESIKDLVQLIEFLTANKENLHLYVDAICALLGMFSKKRRSNFENRGCVYNILIKPLRKLILSSVKSGHVSLADIIEPYGRLLYYYLLKNKKLKAVITILNVLIFETLDKMTSVESKELLNHSTELLLTVLRYRTKLSEFLPEDFVTKLWKSLLALPVTTCPTVILKVLFSTATNEEIAYFLDSLLLHTRSQGVSVSQSLPFWVTIMEFPVGQNMINVKQQKVSELCHFLLESRFSFSLEESRKILTFEGMLTKNLKIIMEPHMIDLCLLSIRDFQETNVHEFQNHWLAMCRLSNNLISCRSALILERVPGYSRCVHLLFTSLAKRSGIHVSLPADHIKELAQCGSSLARLFSSLCKHRKDFQRVSSYLLASCLIDIEKYPVYEEVKVGLMSCVHSLMSMCDNYSISFLLRVLPPSTAELFNIIYKGYKKYVKFQGRV